MVHGGRTPGGRSLEEGVVTRLLKTWRGVKWTTLQLARLYGIIFAALMVVSVCESGVNENIGNENVGINGNANVGSRRALYLPGMRSGRRRVCHYRHGTGGSNIAGRRGE